MVCSVCGRLPPISPSMRKMNHSGLVLGRCQACYSRLKRERRRAEEVRLCVRDCGRAVPVRGRVCRTCRDEERSARAVRGRLYHTPKPLPQCACGASVPRKHRRVCDTCHALRQQPGHRDGAGLARRKGRARQKKLAYKGDRLLVCSRLYEQQGGCCAVCQKHHATIASNVDRSGLVLDHDHTTGEARALLCRTCNIAVGQIHESVDKARGLLAYCERIQLLRPGIT